jgi:uncharacterized protein YkwD
MPSRAAWTGVFLVLSSVLVVGAAVAVVDTDAEIDTDADGATPDRADRINESAVEEAMHAELNALRTTRGLAPLPQDRRISAQATAWSARMANGSYEHSERGYYACPAGTAENIATLPAYGPVELDTGEVVRYGGNETRLGKALIGVWNRSPPHRENMLDPTHTAHAPGIAVGERNGSTTLYATSGFCSE